MKTRTKRGSLPAAQGRITARRLAPAHGISTRQIVRAVRMTLGDRPCRSLSVVVVTDKQIARLHEQFMADPSPTDVLTFDLRDDPADVLVEGEIILSAETAERQAREYRVGPGEELLRYAIHGTLHLIGYNDHTPTDQRQMRREEDRILGQLNSAEASAGRRAPTRRKPAKKRTRTTSRAQR